jgi:hypothetical protein
MPRIGRGIFRSTGVRLSGGGAEQVMSMHTMTDLVAGSHSAVSAFLRRCVVPLIGDHEKQTTLYGCGTLFADRGGHYLVTAAHVIADVPNAELGIPLDDGDSEIWTISATRAAMSPINQEDVAVVELDEKILSRLRAVGYRSFLGPANVLSATPEVYLAFGYRLDDVVVTESSLGAVPTLISARGYKGATDGVANVEIGWYDLLLEWQHDLSLSGISGSPLWAVEPAREGFWLPEHSLRLVGVQKGAVEKRWIRGTQWKVVSKMIDSLAESRRSG